MAITISEPPAYHTHKFPQIEAVLGESVVCDRCDGFEMRIFKAEGKIHEEQCDQCLGRRILNRGEHLLFDVWGGARKNGYCHTFSIAVSVAYPWKVDQRTRERTEFGEDVSYGPRALERMALRTVSKLLRQGADISDESLLFVELKATDVFKWPEEWPRQRSHWNQYNGREIARAREDGVVSTWEKVK